MTFCSVARGPSQGMNDALEASVSSALLDLLDPRRVSSSRLWQLRFLDSLATLHSTASSLNLMISLRSDVPAHDTGSNVPNKSWMQVAGNYCRSATDPAERAKLTPTLRNGPPTRGMRRTCTWSSSLRLANLAESCPKYPAPRRVPLCQIRTGPDAPTTSCIRHAWRCALIH